MLPIPSMAQKLGILMMGHVLHLRPQQFCGQKKSPIAPHV